MKAPNIRFKSSDLIEKSDGLRFNVPQRGPQATGFVVRFNGKAYAYLNQCAHVPIELDWQHGKFFNLTQDFIICATHGAHYEPSSGRCVLGPCKGKSLKAIEVQEINDEIIINVESIR